MGDGRRAALRVRGIVKSYGPVRALDGVSLQARPGEVTGLIGPNGSGKTTLLEAIAGLLPVDAGEVAVEADGGSRLEVRHALFYLADAISPWCDQSVAFVLDCFRRFHSVPLHRLDELSGALSLEPFLERRVGELSKGQRKRSVLALGLLVPRPVLLLDEPLDGLDLRQARDLTLLLRREADAGRTLLVAVHQLSDAARLCDRFILLSAGRVAGAGTLEELRETSGVPQASLEDAFLALT